eukprot:1191856-Prorocentrum_minimum.AAC.1
MASAAVSTTCSALLTPAGAQRETQSLRRSAPSMRAHWKSSTCTLKLPRTQLASSTVGQLWKRGPDSPSTSLRCSRTQTRAGLDSETGEIETVRASSPARNPMLLLRRQSVSIFALDPPGFCSDGILD